MICIQYQSLVLLYFTCLPLVLACIISSSNLSASTLIEWESCLFKQIQCQDIIHINSCLNSNFQSNCSVNKFFVVVILLELSYSTHVFDNFGY